MSVIKSIQRGIFNDQGSITVNAVNPNKSVVICNAYVNDMYCRMPVVRLVNPTTIGVYTMAGDFHAAWQLIEFI